MYLLTRQKLKKKKRTDTLNPVLLAKLTIRVYASQCDIVRSDEVYLGIG